jgi:hypothetical protein
MRLIPIESSLLKSFAYVEDRQIFVAQFVNDASVYAYLGVDTLIADGFTEAESQGSFFIANIKGKKGEPIHNYRKLGGPEIVDEEGNISDDLLNVTEQKPVEQKKQGKPLPPASDIQRPAAKTGEVISPKAAIAIPELPVEDEELKATALSVQDQARALVIANGPDFSNAEAFVITIKQMRKQIYDRLDQVVKPALEAYRQAQRLRDESVAPLDEAERITKGSMLAYSRREAEERAQREREETARRQEQARLEAEEQARLIADQEAAALELQGELELAQSVRANPLPLAPAPVAPVVLERDVPRGRSSIKEKWAWRGLNEVALLQHVVPGITPAQVAHLLTFVTVDDVKLNRYATTTKLAGTIPGALEVYDAGSVSTRSK